MKPIPYSRHSIDEDDIAAVIAALQSDFITQGPLVEGFEEQLAAYHGCRYAVAFSNGTAALHGAYFAAGIGPGDELITSANSFVASANAGIYQGALPALCDIEMESYNIDIEKIEGRITSKTKVITPVSYAGNPVDIQKIAGLARDRGITIIHDAAHALGARLNGGSICDYADMTMLSFHPAKHVATGEGGAILTNDPEAYKKLRLFRTHGITKDPADFLANEGGWYYEMQALGYNYRIPDILCALGIAQLRKLDHSICQRNQVARRYDEAFHDLGWLSTPQNRFDQSWVEQGSSATASNIHAYHLYPVLLDHKIDRLDFYNYMRQHQVLVQVHYIPIHYMPYYQRHFGYVRGDFPVVEDFYAREVSLPMYPSLTECQQSYVMETVKKYGACIT